MRTCSGHDIAGLAAGLGHDNVHVWQLPYRRAQGRMPLRALLAIYLGVSPEVVTFHESAHGRPALASPSQDGLHFNWSHSGDRAVIAIAYGVEPGIDLEQVRPRPRALELAARFFHPAETAALAARDEAALEAAFLRLWTAKEAVLKAPGRGLAFGLERLQLENPAQPRLRCLHGEAVESWQLQALEPDAGYVGHIAWRGPSRRIESWTLADSD